MAPYAKTHYCWKHKIPWTECEECQTRKVFNSLQKVFGVGAHAPEEDDIGELRVTTWRKKDDDAAKERYLEIANRLSGQGLDIAAREVDASGSTAG